jgi:hypothetical protein
MSSTSAPACDSRPARTPAQPANQLHPEKKFMKTSHLLASLAIIACTSAAWFLLGAVLAKRTAESSATIHNEVAGVWGPPITQNHPHAWYETPNAPSGRAVILPSTSQVTVDLKYDPKQRGLLWHRTYDADFRGDYVFTNPTRIPQTLYVSFPLPAGTAGLHGFRFQLGADAEAGDSTPGKSGVVTRAIVVPASGSVDLQTAYRTRGTGTWGYDFPDNRRIAGFRLDMRTDFLEIDFPAGTGSPGSRAADADGWDLAWEYPDVLAAPAIGMDMPKQLNAGPVAARIAFFAPVSLVFFITILLLMGGLRGVALHPMHVFFVAAGFFAFHLLFAYLVDLIALRASFAIATAVSVLLVCGYLNAVGGKPLLAIALPAQLAYLVLFSASFFFDGLTGITLTTCGVATLALLMFLTAKIDWRRALATPPADRNPC